MGRLGKIFSNYSNAFGSETWFYDPHVSSDDYPHARKYEQISDFLSELDVLSIHIHASDENRGCINKDSLDMWKKDIVIVKT